MASHEGSLLRGALDWKKVAALGVAFAISGNFSGWNYGLLIGGWGGMCAAAVAMSLLFFCLTQCLAELATALPEGAGFDFYARAALGPASGYLCGMAVAVALAMATGLVATFAGAYLASLLGIGGWATKACLFLIVMGIQLRGAKDAALITMTSGLVALCILAAFCLFVAPYFDAGNLLMPSASGSLLPYGWLGATKCIPFALVLFLGVEQAAQAASETKDLAASMPKALAAAIGVSCPIGFAVLLFATADAGVERLGTSDDPLFAAIAAHSPGHGATIIASLTSTGALIALAATFFSLAYAGSRQIFHLSLAGELPRLLARTNRRQAPSVALLLVAIIGFGASWFPPATVLVVFVFLIGVSYVLVIVSFMWLRHRQPNLHRPYRAVGGQALAGVGAVLSVGVVLSCFQSQPMALAGAALGLGLLLVHYLARTRARLPSPMHGSDRPQTSSETARSARGTHG